MQLTVVLDSDGLIKLTKAGALAQVIATWNCLIPRAVYKETVERGKQEAYPDAEEIERLVKDRVQPFKEDARAKKLLASAKAKALGQGEQEALHLFFNRGADAIITDDRAFLTVLERADLPALPPALALVELVRCGGMGIAEAMSALSKMRALIRADVYRQAHADLKGLEKREGR